MYEIFFSRNIFNLTSILSDIGIVKLAFFWVLISWHTFLVSPSLYFFYAILFEVHNL